MTRNEKIKLITFPVVVILVLGLISSFYAPSENYSIGDERLDKVLNDLMMEEKNSLDVIILGDSLTYSGISPYHLWNEYGYTSFVCGSPSQMINNTYEMLEAVLVRQTPKVVILETNVIYQVTQQRSIMQSVFFRAFPVLRYHNNWKGEEVYTGSEIGSQNRYKGYMLRTNIRPGSGEGHMTPSPNVNDIASVNKYYFDKIHDMCEENNIEFIIISVPSTQYWDYTKHNAVVELAEEYGVQYWDFNLDENLDIDWSVDTPDKGGHMNIYGAKKITSYLGELLTTEIDSTLTDHRGDAAYDVWNEGWEAFRKKFK